jgi:hypothetical protein
MDDRKKFEAFARTKGWNLCRNTNDEYAFAVAAGAWAAWQAALSAQPSPGGQGDALDEVACDLPALFGRASLEGHEVGQRLAKEVQAKMRAALAARQPVGEPVARSIIEEFVQCADVGRPPGKLLAQARDYLAAPPAPAVDLERFRPAVMTALGLSSPYGLERETLNELLDLIDSRVKPK